MKNKIQNYIVLLIVMMSTASAFSQIFGGPGDGNNCNIYSYRDADRDGYGVKSQRICDKDVPDGYSLKFGDRDDSNALITDLPPKYFYFDKDKDTYGDPNKKVYASRKPNGYVTNNSDYDDNTGLITNIAPRNFYRDYDKDGFGNPGNKVYRSAKPSGYVTDARDCNDGDINTNPNTIWYLDGDNDGYSRSTKKQCTSPGSKYKRSVTGPGDCNDGDATLNPLTVWYYDNDGDGFGNEGDLSTVRQQCSSPGSKYVRKKGDINDNNEYITNIAPKNFYRDGDKDTYGNPNIKYYRSFAPSDGHTYVTNGSDYDDSTGHITNIAPKNFYRDGDKDSYGNPNIKYYRSKAPSDGYIYVTNGSDRDDGNKWITNIAPKNFYRDGDKDTFGNPNIKYYRSVAPNDGHVYVTNGNDCNDGDINTNPNTIWYLDGDNDGYSRSTKKQCTSPGSKYKRSVTGPGDCNDGDATLNPLTVWYYDNDGDGFGNEGDLSTVRQQCGQPSSKYVRKQGDINDNNEYITDVPPKNFYRDADKDTYGNPSVKFYRSKAPSDTYRYVLNGNDRDDSNEYITNIAPKNFYRDVDKDTYGNPNIKFYRSAAPNDVYSYVTNGSDYDDDNEFITNIAPKNFYRDGDDDTFGNPSIKYYRSAAPNDGHTYVLNGNDCDDGNDQLHPNTVWYKNVDGDNFAASTIERCTSPGVGYTRQVLALGDCDDNDITRHPDTIWYADEDGDTWGDSNVTKKQCSPPAKYVLRGGDYDDSSENIINITPQTFFLDGDNDGFGDPNQSVSYSIQPDGYVLDNTDKCPDVFGSISGCKQASYESLSLSNENYILTKVYQEEMTSEDQIQFNKDVIENVTYFDGLGRQKQQVAVKASPTGKDIVTHMQYDNLGRQTKQYLPFERQNTPTGSYKSVNTNTDINSYYQGKYAEDFKDMTVGSVNAYSEMMYEAAPLNRVKKQGAPGQTWKVNTNNDTDHTVKFDWEVNTVADAVVQFTVDFDGNTTEKPVLVKGNVYAAKELYVTITKDENWKSTDRDNHTTKQYTNKLGQVVLERTFNEGLAHDTYYVFDKFKNLTFVIPPKVTIADGVSNNELSELCYQYNYDYRNRVIATKNPGKGWEYAIYNKLDQPILTQDANQRAEGFWLFNKYDVFGRATYSGKIIDTRDRKVLQDEATAYANQLWVERGAARTIGGVTMSYNDGGYPKVTNAEVLTINYYDNYNFDLVGLENPGTVSGEAITNRTRSLPTGSKVKVLGKDKWTTTVTYYDNKLRPIYLATKNEFLNTTDVIESELDFVGKVEKTTTKHKKGTNAEIVTIDTFEYDHMGRVLNQKQTINGQEETIAENSYDDLGQLTSKKIGGGLQDIQYDYNIRGWLTAINKGNTNNGSLFGFKINYNTAAHGATALYNGNVAETEWQTANDNVQRWYAYSYDALNRITKGVSSDGKYDLTNVAYDKVGNIKNLSRHGWQNSSTYANMDVLSYTYNSGNKLLNVIDTGNKNYGFKDGVNTENDFEYDINGNMIKDRNKGITGITYNHLNMPEMVTVSKASNTGNITYIYDAIGTKLKKIVTEGGSLTETEYAGNYTYKNGNLEFFNHTEGYVTKEGNSYRYVYQYRDHLDNIRLSYTDGNNDGTITQDEIIEESNYYPFGLKHEGYNSAIASLGNSTAQSFKYNGVELNESLGLNLYEMDLRQYDPTMARWTAIDPVTHYSMSTYNAFDNNPVFYADPSGADSNSFNEGIGRSRRDESAQIFNFGMTGREVANAEGNDPPNQYQQYFAAKLSQYEALTGVSGNQSIGTSISNFFSKYSDSFSESFVGAFSGIKTLFTNPSALLRVPSKGEILQNQIDNFPGGRLLSFGVKQQIAIMQGDPASLGAVQGAEFGRASIDLAGIAIGAGISRGFSGLMSGGLTFNQYKSLYWGSRIKPVFQPIRMSNGKVFKVHMELHHRFIPQRWKWAPNWLLNNRFNLQPLNTIQHGIRDSYRFRFFPKEIKKAINNGNTFGY